MESIRHALRAKMRRMLISLRRTVTSSLDSFEVEADRVLLTVVGD